MVASYVEAGGRERNNLEERERDHVDAVLRLRLARLQHSSDGLVAVAAVLGELLVRRLEAREGAG